MATGARIVGEKALIRRLDRMSRGARNRMARPAVREAMKPMRQMMKRLAARATGMLAKSIKSVVRTYKGVVFGITGPENRKDAVTGRNPSKYGHLVEFGTAAHTIRPERKRALAIRAGVLNRTGSREVASGLDRNVVAKADHPGTAAQPFMRPAWRAHGGRKSERAIGKRIWQEIQKQARRS